MVNVELIYDDDCQNAEEARRRLKRALAEVGLEPRWQEWNRSDAKSPGYVQGYGSPTILVDGKDVGGALPGDGKSCRVYSDNTGKFSGVPSIEAITSVLLKAKEKGSASRGVGVESKGKGWLGLSVFPLIGTVLLPGIGCPACWPAYAALLSFIGLGFINYTPYLFPLMLLCLVMALFSLGFRARSRRGFSPLVLGSAAALTILTAKFIFACKAATYAAVLLLVAASIWNLWPRRTAADTVCPDCVPAAAPHNKGGTQITPKGS